MGKHKPHLQVQTHKLWSHTEKAFTQNRHSVLDLSRMLISNSKVRGNGLSDDQKSVLRDLRREAIYDLGNSNTGYSRIDVLKAYFDLFDEIFFFGSLGGHGRCEMGVRCRKTGEVTLGGTTETLYKNDRLIRQLTGTKRLRLLITVYVMKSEERRSRYCALLEYCGTLLHEMIHAFLQCWACDYDGCSDAKDRLGQAHGPMCRCLERNLLSSSKLSRDFRFQRCHISKDFKD